MTNTNIPAEVAAQPAAPDIAATDSATTTERPTGWPASYKLPSTPAQRRAAARDRVLSDDALFDL